MIYDFIAPVGIDIRHDDVMPTLARVRIVTILRVENPALLQLAVPPVPRHKHRAAIVPATHHDARTHPIEVRDAREETLVPVAAVVITPVAADAAPAVGWVPVRHVRLGGKLASGAAIENREE